MKGTTDWKDQTKCRNFNTVEEHDNEIINNINKHVGENDILWHIGDFSMGGPDNIWNFRKRINCKNINLILGNHDIHIANNRVLNNCRRSKMFSTDIVDGTPIGAGYFVQAQELFTSVNQLMITKFAGINFTMCHYAMRTWPNNCNDNSIMLHGHNHGDLENYEYLVEDEYNKNILIKSGFSYKTMDVGIDVAFRLFGEYRPFKLEEILEIMEKRIPFIKC